MTLKEHMDAVTDKLRGAEIILNALPIKTDFTSDYGDGVLHFRRYGNRWRLCHGRTDEKPVSDITAVDKIYAAEKVGTFIEAYRQYQEALSERARKAAE